MEPIIIVLIVLFSLAALSIAAALCRIAYVRCEDYLFAAHCHATLLPRMQAYSYGSLWYSLVQRVPA